MESNLVKLNQLPDFRRGALSDTNSDGIPDTVTSPTRQQGWDFDALGNFDTQTTDGTPQTRTHNKQNQSTVVGGNNLTFDANGNTTKDETGKTYTFDAFNRLVLAKDSGGATIATYSFDALGRRIIETVIGTTRDIFFSPGWQVVEEQISGVAKTQYVWSPVYIDALIARDRDADGNGSLEERLYAQQDANFNVTSVINTSGSVVERYVYDPYGTPTFLTASWTALSASAYAWTVLHQGGRYEPVTGLYLFRHRDYSPTLGRWLEVDPIGFSAGDVNFYVSPERNPASELDPAGLQQSQSSDRPSILSKLKPPPMPIMGTRYGNYCGPFSPVGPGQKPPAGKQPSNPGRTPGSDAQQGGKSKDPKPGPNPIDNLDRCCLDHDSTYTQAPLLAIRPLLSPAAAIPVLGPLVCGAVIKEADRTLCNCAKKVDCAKEYPARNQWFQRLQCQVYRLKVMGLFCRLKLQFPKPGK